MKQELQRLRWEIKGWEDHFADWIAGTKRNPPESTKATLTSMWVIAKDSLHAFETLGKQVDELIRKEAP